MTDDDDYEIGEPDTTPDDAPFCMVNAIIAHDSHGDLVTCTREPGHAGNHAAGNGEVIVHAWPAEDDDTTPLDDGAVAMHTLFESLCYGGFTERQGLYILATMLTHQAADDDGTL